MKLIIFIGSLIAQMGIYYNHIQYNTERLGFNWKCKCFRVHGECANRVGDETGQFGSNWSVGV